MAEASPFAWLRGKPGKEQARAIKALSEGTATGVQQRLALSCILKDISRCYDVTFVPGKPDESAYLQGRAFVGLEIVRMIKLPLYELALQPSNRETE